MMDIHMREKAACAERAGFHDLARHLRRWAFRLNIPMPPRAVPTVELPALTGLEAEDLNGLGMPWRRTSDGVLIEVPRRGGRK